MLNNLFYNPLNFAGPARKPKSLSASLAAAAASISAPAPLQAAAVSVPVAAPLATPVSSTDASTVQARFGVYETSPVNSAPPSASEILALVKSESAAAQMPQFATFEALGIAPPTAATASAPAARFATFEELGMAAPASVKVETPTSSMASVASARFATFEELGMTPPALKTIAFKSAVANTAPTRSANFATFAELGLSSDYVAGAIPVGRGKSVGGAPYFSTFEELGLPASSSAAAMYEPPTSKFASYSDIGYITTPNAAAAAAPLPKFMTYEALGMSQRPQFSSGHFGEGEGNASPAPRVSHGESNFDKAVRRYKEQLAEASTKFPRVRQAASMPARGPVTSASQPPIAKALSVQAPMKAVAVKKRFRPSSLNPAVPGRAPLRMARTMREAAPISAPLSESIDASTLSLVPPSAVASTVNSRMYAMGFGGIMRAVNLIGGKKTKDAEDMHSFDSADENTLSRIPEKALSLFREIADSGRHSDGALTAFTAPTSQVETVVGTPIPRKLQMTNASRPLIPVSVTADYRLYRIRNESLRNFRLVHYTNFQSVGSKSDFFKLVTEKDDNGKSMKLYRGQTLSLTYEPLDLDKKIQLVFKIATSLPYDLRSDAGAKKVKRNLYFVRINSTVKGQPTFVLLRFNPTADASPSSQLGAPLTDIIFIYAPVTGDASQKLTATMAEQRLSQHFASLVDSVVSSAAKQDSTFQSTLRALPTLMSATGHALRTAESDALTTFLGTIATCTHAQLSAMDKCTSNPISSISELNAGSPDVSIAQAPNAVAVGEALAEIASDLVSMNLGRDAIAVRAANVYETTMHSLQSGAGFCSTIGDEGDDHSDHVSSVALYGLSHVLGHAFAQINRSDSLQAFWDAGNATTASGASDYESLLTAHFA